MPSEPNAPGDEPNLELPSLSLGFGRRKKRGRSADQGPTATEGSTSAEDIAVGQPGTEVSDATTPADDPASTPPAAPRAPAAPPAPGRASDASTAPRPAAPPARPAARPPSRPAAASPVAPLPVAPEPIPEPPTSGAEDTAALDRSAITPEPDTIRDPLGEAAAAIESSDAPRSRRGRSRSESRARRRAGKVGGERPTAADGLVARLPGIKPLYAAFITGALAGLAAVALATGASRGCEAVRDTSSCGGGLGLLALLGILAIEVVIAATLLKVWQISDPLSTSFLGVALVAIIAMLTFLDELDSVWMLLVIPALTAAAFVLSWWVTVRFVDEYPNASAHHPKGETDESLVE